jgi:hypothetical protein
MKIRPEIRIRDTAAAEDKPPARLFPGVDAVGGLSVRLSVRLRRIVVVFVKCKGRGIPHDLSPGVVVDIASLNKTKTETDYILLLLLWRVQ